MPSSVVVKIRHPPMPTPPLLINWCPSTLAKCRTLQANPTHIFFLVPHTQRLMSSGYFFSILYYYHSGSPHYLSQLFVQRKLWNRAFGTEIPIPQLFFKNLPFFCLFYIDVIAGVLILFYVHFLKKLWNRGFGTETLISQLSFKYLNFFLTNFMSMSQL